LLKHISLEINHFSVNILVNFKDTNMLVHQLKFSKPYFLKYLFVFLNRVLEKKTGFIEKACRKVNTGFSGKTGFLKQDFSWKMSM
jgi:CRISPR/Cas system-associated protein Csx1